MYNCTFPELFQVFQANLKLIYNIYCRCSLISPRKGKKACLLQDLFANMVVFDHLTVHIPAYNSVTRDLFRPSLGKSFYFYVCHCLLLMTESCQGGNNSGQKIGSFSLQNCERAALCAMIAQWSHDDYRQSSNRRPRRKFCGQPSIPWSTQLTHNSIYDYHRSAAETLHIQSSKSQHDKTISTTIINYNTMLGLTVFLYIQTPPC